MRKTSYPASFDPATGTLDCSNVAGFVAAAVLVIADTTAPGRPILYDISTQGLGFDSVSGTTLTLQYDTSGLGADDVIVVFWDDGQSTGDALLAATAALSPATLIANITALPPTLLYALFCALVASAPDLGEGGSVPALNQPLVDLSGFLVKSR